MKITIFEEIEGWQLGRELTRKIYDNKTFNDLYELASHAKSKVGAFIKYLKQNQR